jgi:putative membrane protein
MVAFVSNHAFLTSIRDKRLTFWGGKPTLGHHPEAFAHSRPQAAGTRLYIGITAVRDYLVNALKGMGIGTANVIPGVSGATIAIVTGVFEPLVNAIRSFDLIAMHLLGTGRFKALSQRVNLPLLVPLAIGLFAAIISFARLLEYLFGHYPVYIWAYFFGLILASVYFVGETVRPWTVLRVGLLLAGVAVAVAVTFLNPAVENRNPAYVFLCGVVAICGMILPGISGSFILILMGNYELIVFEAISQGRLSLLGPFLVGCAIGLAAFTHVLSWVLRVARHQTLAVLTGFIVGSLVTIWPWKTAIYRLTEAGEAVLKEGQPVVLRYRPVLPETLNAEVIIALLIMVAGIVSISITESVASRPKDRQ